MCESGAVTTSLGADDVVITNSGCTARGGAEVGDMSTVGTRCCCKGCKGCCAGAGCNITTILPRPATGTGPLKCLA